MAGDPPGLPPPPPVRPRPVRAVIFDMDGVLTDSEPLINAAAVAMFQERGLTVQPRDFDPFVGTGENRYLGGVAEKYGFPLDIPAAKARTYELYLERVPLQLKAFPGAVDLVRAARQAGLKTAVASSADWIKIEANLRSIGLPPSEWDAIVTGDDVALKKPAPDIFLAAARKLGLDPGECVVVEDAVNGIEAAKLAGMRCLAVAQSFPEPLLRRADRVFPGIARVRVEDLAGECSNVGLGGGGSGPGAELGSPPAVARRGPWGAWATLGLSLGIAAAFLLSQFVAGMIAVGLTHVLGHPEWIDVSRAESSGVLWIVMTFASAPVTLALVVLLAWVRRGPPVSEYLGLRPVDGWTLGKWTLALVGFVGATDLISYWAGRPVVPEIVLEVYRTAGWPPLLWMAMVVAAPLVEECFFRGFLFEGLAASRLGPGGAIVITASSWALIHTQYDWIGRLTILGVGLLFGYARWRTGSLYPSLAMHGLMNFLATAEVVWVLQPQIHA